MTETGSGARSGSNWANANASSDLKGILSGASNGDEIWVAKGTYTLPAVTTDTFQLKDRVKLYGGFAGNETAVGQRDFKVNVTILSGGGASRDVSVVSPDNGATNATTIDGFTITGWDVWGGMRNITSSPTITNCSFSGNIGGWIAMYNYSSNPIITNCTFSNNDVFGMMNDNSNPTVTNCTFSDNTAASSCGGMYNANSSNPIVTNCTFSGNSAVDGPGGMLNGYSSSPIVTNCTFSGNTSSGISSYGGGMSNFGNSNPIITNCTFSGNTASGSSGIGGGMSNSDSSPTIVNTIFWGNTAATSGDEIHLDFNGTTTLKNCVIAPNGIATLGGAVSSTNIITANPQITAIDINGNPTTNPASVYIYSISNTSPAIDKGLSVGTVVSASVTVTNTDQRGIARPQMGGVDIGAYEFYLEPTGIILSNTSLNLTVGSTSIISAEVLPQYAYNKITWQSSNTAIATVTPLSSDTQKAAITAIATGTSVITAATYDGKFTASCTVTVTPQDERYPPIEPISADTLKIILKDVLASMPPDSQITQAMPFKAAKLPDEVKLNLGCLDTKGYVTKTPDGTFRIPPSAMVQLASTSVPPLEINANELVSMPIFEALISPDMTAVMGFQILGKDFKAPSAGAIILLKAQSDGNVKRYIFTQSASSLTDGHYMLTDASGKIFTASEALIEDKQYILVMSIQDNGGYDLDLEKGHILDPASMTSSAHDIQSNQSDPGGGMGGCNAQGINILLAGVIAGMVCVKFKKF